MARLPRAIAAGTAHHITQRGIATRDIFESEADRRVYLELLAHSCRLHKLRLHGYCLMPGHIHLIAVPELQDSLHRALQSTHGRYTSYLNARQQTSGHVWQGCYYSCPLNRYHLWKALRHTERNPVRAGLVACPEEYRWSSAAAHCCAHDTAGLLDFETWWTRFTPVSWRRFLADREADTGLEIIRRRAHTGHPLEDRRSLWSGGTGVAVFARASETRLEEKNLPRNNATVVEAPLFQRIAPLKNLGNAYVSGSPL